LKMIPAAISVAPVLFNAVPGLGVLRLRPATSAP
jgi:hypothetical protein